jgi:hypothetical protein
MYIQGDWVRRAFLMDWTVLICYICLMTHLCHDGRFLGFYACMFNDTYVVVVRFFFGCVMPLYVFNYVVAIGFFAMDVLYQLNLIMSWLLYVFLLWILNATLIQLWIKRLLSLLCMLNTAFIQLCRSLRFYFLLCMFNATLIQLCRGLRFYFLLCMFNATLIRNWFAMQGPVAIILISWNVIFI